MKLWTKIKPAALLLFAIARLGGPPSSFAAGDWPEPRQNSHLTAWQPMAGEMRGAPAEIAAFDLGRSWPAVTAVARKKRDSTETETIGLCVVAGELRAYDLKGEPLWRSHPPGLNYLSVVAAEDLNGDGEPEALVECGRPAAPFGAAALVAIDDGRVLWRHDVDPMSYDWHAHAGEYLPGGGRQVVVIMHGYPPDKKNGYIALFDWPVGAAAPRQRWRYDFDQYTCFPTIMQTDLDGDGAKELVVETHSRMWLFDAPTGAVKSFVQWDVSPANIRSYGLVRFLDLDGDAREDFLCIATFAQHHEVLLNRGGKLEKAWGHGWPESVTTGKVATRWAEPPEADIDGDGKPEIVLSMFNSEGESAWQIRAYDAAGGAIKFRAPGLVAAACADIDGDGAAEILADASADPTFAKREGARLLKAAANELKEIWRDDAARADSVAFQRGQKRKRKAMAVAPPAAGAQADDRELVVQKSGANFSLESNDGAISLEAFEIPPRSGPDFSKIPATVGPTMPLLLAADADGDGANELILHAEPTARVLKLKNNKLEPAREYASTSIPVFADLDGDGKNEIVTSRVGPEAQPVVEAASPVRDGKILWKSEFPPPGRAGLPQPRKAYIRALRLTGKATPDLYVWAGTPVVRSAGLEGATGRILWDKGEAPGIERYWGASMNYAAACDFNNDGNEDLAFTNPDYYCVADGPTGEALFGPEFPPKIFDQPCQGLYTYPAILDEREGPPTVALVAGHYFQAAMSLKADPYWYRIPDPGENRCAAEAFLLLGDGTWLMGFARQNGNFACLGARDGKARWELPLEASGTDAAAGDVDGDGRQEFVVATSHGELLAVGDGGGKPRVLWRMKAGGALGAPILADLDADGKIEIACPAADGRVLVFAARGAEAGPVR